MYSIFESIFKKIEIFNSCEFFIERSNEEQAFKDYKFDNYSIKKANDKKIKEN